MKKEEFWLVEDFFSEYLLCENAIIIFSKNLIDDMISKAYSSEIKFTYELNAHNVIVDPYYKKIMVTGLMDDDPKVYFAIEEFKKIYQHYLRHLSLPEEYKPDIT